MLENGKMGKMSIPGWGRGRGTKAHATQVMWVWERQVSLLDSYDNLLST